MSLAFSREAWRHLAPNIGRVLAEPRELEARGAMQLGACLAGLAIENSMLGAAHALANPLTAEFGIVHGEAIALMLPHVIRHNGRQVEAWYGELVACVPASLFADNQLTATDALAEFVSGVSRQASLPATLREAGVRREALPRLVAAAAQQWTGKFNPVELSTDDYLQLYEAAY